MHRVDAAAGAAIVAGPGVECLHSRGRFTLDGCNGAPNPDDTADVGWGAGMLDDIYAVHEIAHPRV